MSNMKTAMLSNAVKNSRTMMMFVSFTVVMTLGTFALTSKAVSTYNEAMEIQEKTTEMKSTIQDWKGKVEFINQQSYRPVSENQIDSVNSDILMSIGANNLKLTDFQVSKASEQKISHDFSLKIAGQYKNVIHFLALFQAKDALVNLMSIHFVPRDGMLEADVIYRIYTK